jgi:hypothetical protein
MLLATVVFICCSLLAIYLAYRFGPPFPEIPTGRNTLRENFCQTYNHAGRNVWCPDCSAVQDDIPTEEFEVPR